MPLFPSPDPPTDRVSRTSTGPRLRDSCRNCAASKLKCSKEKPTCARCLNRGRVCEYLASRRAGRTQGTSSINMTSIKCSSSTEISWTNAGGMVAGVTPGLGNVVDTEKGQGAQFPGIYPDDLLSAQQQPDKTPSGIFPLFDDSFSTPEVFDLLNNPDVSPEAGVFDARAMENYANYRNTTFDDNAPELNSLLFDGGFSENSSYLPSHVSTISNSEMQPNFDTGSFSLFESGYSQKSTPDCSLESGSSKSCLIRALWILQELSPNASTGCTSTSTFTTAEPGTGTTTDNQRPIATIEAVIAQNRKTVETMDEILQCPCAQDSYLLTILALAIFKVLGWYEAVAHRNFESHDQVRSNSGSPSSSITRRLSTPVEQVVKGPVTVGYYHIDGPDGGRMAAQLVLSELSRLQGLVKSLSQRLIVMKGNWEIKESIGQEETLSDEKSSEDKSYPFSCTLLRQLEIDLRKRLRGLSAEIVERLRHE